MREEERILAGLLFSPADPELRRIKQKTHNLNIDYNQTHEDEMEKRAAILREMLGELEMCIRDRSEGEHEVRVRIRHRIPYTGYFGEYLVLNADEAKRLSVA